MPGLRSESFRWFLGGQTISMAGSSMSPVALAFGVLQATGSAGWLSLVTASALAPMLATLLLGGGLADRYRRDTVLLLASIGSGLAQAGVAVALLTHAHPAVLLPLSALAGTFQGLTTPTLRGIIPSLAAGRDLQRAGALLASASNTTRIVGPTVAGLLTAAAGGGWAIAADAASFLLAAACFARMTLPVSPPRAQGAPTMLTEMREGWSYFRTHPWIWTVTSAFAVFNGLDRAVFQILGPVVASTTIGAGAWGLVLGAQGAGALLGGALMVKLALRRPMVPALTAMAAAATPLILLGAGAATPWLAAATFLAGVATEVFTVAWSTVCNTHIPQRLLSRVGAHDEFWSRVSFPAGQLATPLLVATLGTAVTAITGGAVAALAMLVPLLLPSLRRMELDQQRADRVASPRRSSVINR